MCYKDIKLTKSVDLCRLKNQHFLNNFNEPKKNQVGYMHGLYVYFNDSEIAYNLSSPSTLFLLISQHFKGWTNVECEGQSFILKNNSS